jgi:hypothetical protein
MKPFERPDLDFALSSVIGRPRTALVLGPNAGPAGLVAKAAGARVVALTDSALDAEATKRLVDSVVQANLTEPSSLRSALGQQLFDVIIVPSPVASSSLQELLQACAEQLEPEGRVLVRAQNPDAWGGALDATGTSLSRDTAVELVERCGLELLHVESSSMLTNYLTRALLNGAQRSGKAHRERMVVQMYLASTRPVESGLTRLAPQTFAVESWVVARRKPTARKLDITIGMLTMDEEPSVARMIDEIRRYAPDAKILCVDSSMKDQTPVIAERMGARVLRQLPPRGHGPAMELLMYEASKQSDALIYLDCDFTYPPSVIPTIKEILESGVDVVNANRIAARPDAMPMTNYMANRTFVMCARALNGIPVGDLHSGMRGYRSSVIRSFAFDGEGDALPIDTLLWPARCGYHVVEIPIEYQERVGFSKLRKVAGTVWTFIRLGKTLSVGARRRDTYDVWSSLTKS